MKLFLSRAILLSAWGLATAHCSASTAAPTAPSDGSDTAESRQGAPCGDWNDGAMHMAVACATGLTCRVSGSLTGGSQLAMCVQDGAARCSPCPAGDACGYFDEASACLMPCQSSSDCVGPFEVCLASSCNFQECSQDLGCPADAHCNGQVCEKN